MLLLFSKALISLTNKIHPVNRTKEFCSVILLFTKCLLPIRNFVIFSMQPSESRSREPSICLQTQLSNVFVTCIITVHASF